MNNGGDTVRVDDLHPADQLTDTGTIAALVISITLLIVGIITLVVIRKTRHIHQRPIRAGSHSHHADIRQWHTRINTIVEQYQATQITAEQAYRQSACLARDFASHTYGKNLRTHTLRDLHAESLASHDQQSLRLLQQTIAALYPPEFSYADSLITQDHATVQQAASWVSTLVERWRYSC